MKAFSGIYAGKRVLVTGHTGFKGTWLSLWLHQLGAMVTGLSIDVPTTPSLFELVGLREVIDHRICDIRAKRDVAEIVEETSPEFVFHLAAQALVSCSYTDPVGTLETNVVGTANVIDAIRLAGISCTIVAATSDKCYRNDGRSYGYRETDPMGGSDPYSMSKGAAELVLSSWRSSYFSEASSRVRLASGRAGNVIGGGDWATDRIVPDCIGTLAGGYPLVLRNPGSTRPWQHVLEPLSGYLWLGHQLQEDPLVGRGWNFGPDPSNVRTVEDLSRELIRQWGSGEVQFSEQTGRFSESAHLLLDIELAGKQLNWFPVWAFDRTVAETVKWYKHWNQNDEDLRDMTICQIRRYTEDAASQNMQWADDCGAMS